MKELTFHLVLMMCLSICTIAKAHPGIFERSSSLESKESGPRKRFPVVLHSPRESNWGSWSNYVSTCSNGAVVVGMQLKSDLFHGNQHSALAADNTALNGVKFFCSAKKLTGNILREFSPNFLENITNEVQRWGKWGGFSLCRNGYAMGFQLRSLKPMPNGEGFGFKFDDVGACNLRLYCSNGEILEGDGRNEWGRWTAVQKCPKGQALCSLRTQIERDQLFYDTALNNIDVGCCPVNLGFLSLHNKESTESNHLISSGSDRNQSGKQGIIIKKKKKGLCGIFSNQKTQSVSEDLLDIFSSKENNLDSSRGTYNPGHCYLWLLKSEMKRVLGQLLG